MSVSLRFSSSYDGGASAEPQRQAAATVKKAASPLAFAEPTADDEGSQALASSSSATAVATGSTAADALTESDRYKGVLMTNEMKGITKELDDFFDEKDRQMSHFVRSQNEVNVKLPPRPEELVPAFERVKRSAKILVRFNNPDDIVHEQKYNYVALPPSKEHPWVPYTKHGKHIVHGDGMLNVVGTGEVGFDNTFNEKTLPKSWRGLQKRSNVGEHLPLKNGSTIQDAVVKYSLQLTGKGLFATRDIKKGELMMIVDSTAQNVGFNDEQSRMIEMTADILRNALAGGEEERHYLHHWILTGQLSSIVERWRRDATDKVIELIGGEESLAKLELHREHIPRIAAIIHMNSFLVESQYAERRGVAYWPEAAMLNHSCEPNTTYEIVPEQMFTQSEFYIGTSDQELMHFESENINAAMAADAGTVSGSGADGGGGGGIPPKPVDAAAPEAEASSSSSCSASSSAGPSSSAKNSGGCGDPSCTASDCAGGHSSELTTTPNNGSSEGNVDNFLANPNFGDLTPRGANTFLFCARATKDIAAGEEILISYVPTEWPFAHRQEVLLDRYKFRCKCPRCSPDIEYRHNFMTKFLLPTLALTVSLHLMLSFARTETEEDDEIDLQRWKIEHQSPLPGVDVAKGNREDPYANVEHLK